MIRRRIAILFLPALAILLAAAAFAWLMRTEPGARWIWQRIVAATPGQLQAQQLSGDLKSGLRITRLDYRDERLAVSVDEISLRLDLDLWPFAVAVHELRFGDVDLRGLPPASGEREAATADSPADWIPLLALPVPFEFGRVQGHRLAWTGVGADEPGLDIRQLSFTAWWYRRLELRRLELQTSASRWKGDLELGLAAPFELDVEARVSVAAAADGGWRPPLEVRARGSGDLDQLRIDVGVAEPGVAISGMLRQLDTTPSWDLQLTAAHLAWPLSGSAPSLSLDDVNASSYGSVDDYGIEVEASLSAAGLAPLAARLVGSGSSTGMEFQALDLVGADAELDGTARLDWRDKLRVEAALDIGRLDPSVWLEAWGEAQPLGGRLELAWGAEGIEFVASEVKAPGTFAALQGTGTVGLDGGAIEARLAWRELAWPPGAAEPRVFSQTGSVEIGGGIDAWSARGELELRGPDFPPGRLQLAGAGDTESLHFEVPRGEVLDGELAGAFDVRWNPEFSWSATARVRNIATAPLAPAFPGHLSGDLSVQGRSQPLRLDVDIRQLAGVVRERQVRAAGRLALRDGLVSAQALQLQSGESTVTVDGNPTQGPGLAFTARIESLADLLDGAAGSLSGSGTLLLAADRPELRLNLQGQELAWGTQSVGRLSVTTDDSAAAEMHIELQDIGLDDRELESLNLVTGGSRPLERIEAELLFGSGRISLSMAGGVNDWSAPAASGWSGRLERLRVDGDAVGYIELEEPAALSAKGFRFDLAPACFRGSRAGRLCLESTWRLDGERNLEASLEDVSPNLALTLLESDLQFTQRLTGTLQWRQLPGGSPEAMVRLGISPGEITIADDEEAIITTGAGLFGFEVADGRLYSGNLDIPVPGAGGINTDFGVPDLSAGLASPMQGRIQVNLASIEPVLRLVPGVEGSSGPVTADLSFSGTLTDPELTGHISLVRGKLSHFASGLLLEDIRLAGAVYKFDQTELTGQFRAGDGLGSIRAVLNFSNILEPELLLELQGDNLTVVNVPDLTVAANPDVRLVWRQGELSVAGRVLVPRARLSPRYLPTSAAAESPDVVVVAGMDPLAVQQPSRASQWRLRGSLELELGDDVQLTLERARAQLKGKTGFKWKGKPVPVADGGFSLTGEINAYGQLLKVTEGRVNFSNRPADNPFLNIRAEREIYGNTQVRRAGVLVTGTLKQPILEPYSVPMTTRERALTLLVTGSDFNYEQGVGTVEVGMYVAPKLYISYGIGLFDEQNVISARYDLGKGFGIKTTSGQRETGADISYTIEH